MLKEWLKKIAASFQPAYNRLNDLKLSPQTQQMLDSLWEKLEPEVKKALTAFIMALVSAYGVDRAKKMLTAVLERV